MTDEPQRRVIAKWSPDERPYANLLPIVEALGGQGNRALTPFVSDPSGWNCLVSQPIDFDFIEEAFDLPPNVTLSRDHDTVLDRLSWSAILGPGSRVDLRETS